MKKTLLLFIALVLVVSPVLFAGGRSASQASVQKAVLTPNGQFPLTTTKAQLSAVSIDASWQNNLNNNKVTAWYESKTNVHVNWTVLNHQTIRDELNLLIAAGEYPDLIIYGGLSAAEIFSYGTQGLFLPLEDLYEKYGYYAKRAYDRIDSLPGALVQTDGHIYALGSINECFHCMYMDKLWINQKWLTTLGLAAPTTTEEFYNVLKAFKTRDPNGNGKADELPLVGAVNIGDGFNFILSAFMYWGQDYMSLNNGRVVFNPVQDDFKEGMLYIRRLVSEGLLDPVTFTQDGDQLKALATQDTQLVGSFPGFYFANALNQWQDTPDHRVLDYPALSPLKGPKGIQWTRYTNTGYNTTQVIITDHCKDPDLAFRWIDGLYEDEVTLIMGHGMEGDGWVKPASGAVGINGKPAIYDTPRRGLENPLMDFADNVLNLNNTADVRLGQVLNTSDPMAQYDAEPWLYINTRDHMEPYADQSKQLPLVINFTEAENTELAILFEQLETYMKEAMVAFATGIRDINRDWDSFKADLARINYSRYIQLYQTAYDRQYGRR
ncbi:MAG: extracellular solute-binding protein [Treponema sp.]|nr:extracellular solute-binding protein [Treponema sp.]